MVQEIKEQVSSLEKALEDFIRHTDLGFAKVQNAMIEQKRSLDDFKEEMRLSRERSEKEMAQSRERSEKEMQQFKEEMRLAYERSDRSLQQYKEENNKRWGELANRLGTLAEDFVAPNIPAIALKYFNCPEEPETFFVRCKKRHTKEKALRREFDIIGVYEKQIILNETKSTPRRQYIDEFAELLPQFFDYFPEYGGKKLIPVFASLYVDEQTVAYATKKGIYVLAIKGDTMDLLNYGDLRDRP